MPEEGAAEGLSDASPFASAANLPVPGALTSAHTAVAASASQGMQIPSPRPAAGALPPRPPLPSFSPAAGSSYGASSFLPHGASLPAPLTGPFGCLHLGGSPTMPAPISLFQAPAGAACARHTLGGLSASASLPLGLHRGLFAAAPSAAAVPSLTIAPLDLQSSLKVTVGGGNNGRFGSSVDSEAAHMGSAGGSDAPLGSSAPSPSTVLPPAGRAALEALTLEGCEGRARGRPQLPPPLQLARKGGGGGISKKVAGAAPSLKDMSRVL